jgi:hypothetical protein
LLLHFKMAEAGDPQAALAALETWLQFDAGQSVLSRAAAWCASPRSMSRSVRFASMSGCQPQTLAGRSAALLTALEPGHPDRKQSRLAAPKLADSDPGACWKTSRLKRPLPVSRSRALAGIAGRTLTTWWKRANSDPRLASSGGKRPTPS